jgi:Zn-dependent protease with chaperone function
MKTTLILLTLLLLPPSLVSGQINLSVSAKNTRTGKEYTFFSARKIISSTGSTLAASVKGTPGTVEVPWNEIKNLEFLPENTEQFWEAEGLKAKLYDNLLRKGFQYDQRRKLEEEMNDFLSKTEENGLFYVDSYLESRLYALLRRVHPMLLVDGRPGSLSIRIISDIVPDAWTGPDGTLVLTTAMLTIVNSEDELLALMAQEVAHFVLDHHIDNYNAILASLGDPSLAQVIRYSREQEIQADQCAAELLKMMGKSPALLSSVLQKVLKYGEMTGNYYLTSSSGLFPIAGARTAALGFPGEYSSGDYEMMISPVLTHNAYKAYNRSQFLLCLNLVERNIISGVASVNDYILISEATLLLYDTPEKNDEALMMARKAASMAVPVSPAAYKQEALVLLRMGRNAEAEKALERCASALEGEFRRYSEMAGDWSQMITYLTAEMDWVRSVMRKVKG